MRKTTSPSSPSSSSSPRAPGVNRYGRSGLDSQQFHTGPIASKAAAVKTSAMRARRQIHRHGHCPRCDARLVGGKCPSCGADPRYDFDDGATDWGE